LAEGDNVMDCVLIRIAPGGGGGGAYAHEGEEFVFVLSGRLAMTIDGLDHYELKAGDSLYFKSTSPHAWNNPGRIESRVLWVNTPPSC
jgi:mannose-6-phosphate isomerase-like protein (cupin superfamily)